MRVTFGAHFLTLRSWKSKGEMIQALRDIDARTVTLGQQCEYEKEFYSCVVHLEPPAQNLGICVLSEGQGAIPNLLLQPENGVLVFGFNREVVGIRVPDGQIAFQTELPSTFYSFTPLREWQMILAFHELGVAALRDDGRALWKFRIDVLTTHSVEGDSLRLESMEGNAVLLDLVTGRPKA